MSGFSTLLSFRFLSLRGNVQIAPEGLLALLRVSKYLHVLDIGRCEEACASLHSRCVFFRLLVYCFPASRYRVQKLLHAH